MSFVLLVSGSVTRVRELCYATPTFWSVCVLQRLDNLQHMPRRWNFLDQTRPRGDARVPPRHCHWGILDVLLFQWSHTCFLLQDVVVWAPWRSDYHRKSFFRESIRPQYSNVLHFTRKGELEKWLQRKTSQTEARTKSWNATYIGRRPPPGVPLRVAGPEVLRRACGLLRVARGRSDRGLAPDHGLDVNF